MISDELKFAKDRLNMVVAYTQHNRFIAWKNELPWGDLLQADLNFIKLLFELHEKVALIMGKKTFKCIKKPFPNCFNAVLSRTELFEGENIMTFSEIDDAINYCKDKGYYCIIFGGTRIFEETLKYPHKMYATIVEDKDFKGDTLMPCYDTPIINVSNLVETFLIENGVKKTWKYENKEFTENNIKFTFNIGDKF
ncbi:Dihydrofolate reductase [Astathelohania contejeani]|uniref:Dihydrofolate reductase n=1 Tax=Astathelohania contejeani TaxID=164912 RepID=A0ABQ7HVU8_9MICR|nr:Dihydrofolate reductase [Thelohania contejeani]